MPNNNYTVCIKRQTQAVSFCIRGCRFFLHFHLTAFISSNYLPSLKRRIAAYTDCIRPVAYPSLAGLASRLHNEYSQNASIERALPEYTKFGKRGQINCHKPSVKPLNINTDSPTTIHSSCCFIIRLR